MSSLRLSALLVLVPAALAAAAVDSRVTAVTVYADRAVVTRTATVQLAAGPAELTFAHLPASLVEQSLQAAGRGTAGATILDVSVRETHLDFTPDARVKELEDQLRALGRQGRALDDRGSVLEAQGGMLARMETVLFAPPTKDVPAPPLDRLSASLTYLTEQKGRLAAERAQLDQQREELQAKVEAVQNQLNELRGAGGRSTKTVTVRVQAAQAGALDLALSYTVGGARWVPAYDARVLAGERAVALGYFGVVRQTTGEDWKDVALTLSTARPSLGGAAPVLTAWNLDVFDPVLLARRNEEQRARAKVMAAPAASAPRQVNMQEMTTDATGEVAALRDAEYAAATIEAGATSASFRVASPSSVPSDGTAQKVPIMTARLGATPEYLTVPKRQATAFLTAKVVNGTDLPLLAGAMNVFLDDTFVATSQLRTVMAGEKFDLALGADEGIAVTHKRVQRFTEQTGLTNSGVRVTYEYLITVQNNKRTAERVVVVDQVPLSRNEKVVVRQLTPTPADLKPTAEGALKWTLDLKPGEKRELTVKFTVEHAADVNVSGLE